jgi:hypothetical protein
MYRLVIIFFTFSVALQAQDKLFFNNGTKRIGILVRLTNDAVFFKNSDTAVVEKINTSDLILLEDYKGLRYVFSKEIKKVDSLPAQLSVKRNALGLQPLSIFVGRATFVYERFTEDGNIGFVIPVSLTFDPFGTLYSSQIDTNRNARRRVTGINIITGLDVNFYMGKREGSKFFVGPRFRYGTDQFLRGIEGYSLQTQVGWRYGKPKSAFVQHFSLGFGFVRILASPGSQIINPKQSYAWYSINYRVGIKW